MKDFKISLTSHKISGLIYKPAKILCSKCGGSGNLKTPENARRTCLSCYGRGYTLI